MIWGKNFLNATSFMMNSKDITMLTVVEFISESGKIQEIHFITFLLRKPVKGQSCQTPV